jgi:hypothetical protein
MRANQEWSRRQQTATIPHVTGLGGEALVNKVHLNLQRDVASKLTYSDALEATR